jgi:hypothetical protein
MKTLLYAAFLMLSVQLNAQVAYYSDEVKAKMDQNKIDGVPTLTGIEFVHKVAVYSDLLEASQLDNNLLNNTLNDIKINLGYSLFNFHFYENTELYIEFNDDQENNVDALKMALNEKNIKSRAISIYARLK